MEISFIDSLRIIGALGLFIFGIKTMSESIQKSFGLFFKQVFNLITKNHFLGIIAGFIISSLILSSSSTTVMAVSFVNTGLITLAESVSIMLGANIGATLISWLVSVFGFNADFSFIYLIIFAIGTPLIFSIKSKLKYIGELIFGLALLFLGLSELIHSVPNLNGVDTVFSFFQETSLGFFSNVFFVLIGAFLTLILQSSSASIVLTQVLCFNGIISFEVALPLVLGQNFGRTINTEIASVSGNVFAKRSARIHSLVNIFGLFWMVIALSVFPIVDILDDITTNVFKTDSIHASFGGPIGIALFHSAYNIINVGILAWFIPQLVRLVTKAIKSKGETDEEHHLEYISKGIMVTPELTLIEAKKEVASFGDLIFKMNGLVRLLLTEKDNKKINNLLKKTKKYEDITDKIEIEVANYLAVIAEKEMSEKLSIQVRGLLSIISDLERMGDIYYQMSKGIERKNESKTWFTPEQRNNIQKMFDLLEVCLTNMNKNLKLEHENVTIDEALNLERKLNALRKKLRKAHFINVENGKYDFKSATIYSDLFNFIEKIGDHAINVTEGLIGEMSDVEENE